MRQVGKDGSESRDGVLGIAILKREPFRGWLRQGAQEVKVVPPADGDGDAD